MTFPPPQNACLGQIDHFGPKNAHPPHNSGLALRVCFEILHNE